jgi:formylmethanofuran dehydrogenase subunit C
VQPMSPDERILVKDEENVSDLGKIMKALTTQLVEDPAKAALLDTMDLVVSIEPTEQPETAITMTFSDGYLVIEPGVADRPDIHVVTDLESLLKVAAMGSGMQALKFMTGPEGKKLGAKMLSGEMQVKGLAKHPVGMLRFSKFLSPG